MRQPLVSDEQRAIFRKVLKSAREERSLSQRDLATAMGVSPAAVAQWETGQAAPRVDTAVVLENALDVPTGTLLRLLGYLHPDTQASTVGSVIEAVQNDPNLTDEDRELLATIYTQLVKRRQGKQPPE
jgi:transcriptional regulator with XRE-family HTH domain